jgi:hypothetical protein
LRLDPFFVFSLLSLTLLSCITFGGIFRGPLAYRYCEWVDTPLNPNHAEYEQSPASHGACVCHATRQGCGRWRRGRWRLEPGR